MGEHQPDPLDIPSFLKRDANNKSEFMSVSNSDVSEDVGEAVKPKVVKPNGASKPTVKASKAKPVKAATKAADKPKAKPAAKAPAKAKAAPKAAAKASKGSEKPKAVKAKAVSADKDQFGLRKGTTRSEAAALYSRKNGATLAEVKERLGSVQLNVLVKLEGEGYTVERIKEKRKGDTRPATRYILKAK